ncbi:oligosaccharyl transferase, archaeosortase A system-associated [Candidatus Halobonum tyrrellensis]|uniref:dolichyl-phosphooligosaccharide-protein glycotransferase n=1 Tax=Candidatus Halobonum tyrrellensis G22 TaxID=1324957 RepID=V4J0N8_9EURY|nr:oligosaccharyl transferase, archaeosortase A system-associated [Candidatus Halobonum tyrrellensis]ESP89037.1 hypothetical protein K933_06293 [Candidatus Halobonum tyrrellensis G22]
MTRANESDEGSSTLGLGYDFGGKSATEVLADLYQIPALVAIVAVMLWIRLQSYDNFTVDGQVFFSGNDAWYHLREVRYAVRHWPFTIPFDPWTYFPYGTTAGQFGTIYDQLVATVAIVVGLGSPSADLVARTLLVAPAVLGALTVIPTYLIGKRFGGKLGGLFGAVVLMLLPGTFLSRGLVGFADHNVAEPFFQAFAVVTLMVALTVAERDRPIWELVEAREWDTLRPTLVWSALAGVATGLYIWVWPPGVLLVGIFGVYLVYQAVSDQANGRSPDHVGFVAVVSMVTTAVMTALRFQETTFSPTSFGLFQPLAALSVAVAGVGLAWLARRFDAREFDDDRLDEYGFAGTVFAVALVGVVVTVLAPVPFFSTIQTNLLRFVGFSAGAATRTIGEAQPFLQSGYAQYYGPFGVVLSEYGFAFVTALAAAVWMLVGPLWRRGDSRDYQLVGAAALLLVFIFITRPLYLALTDALGLNGQLVGVAIIGVLVFVAAARVRYRAEFLFAFVWAAFITSAAFTQVRFNYYLAVAVAAFNAYFLYALLRGVDVDLSNARSARSALPDIETYQALAVALAVMVVLVPVLVVPLSLGDTGSASIDRTNTAWQVGNSTSPGAVTIWDDSLDWMGENTPAVGNYGGAGNADQLGYYEPYDIPADNDFDYAEGSYGVMSWWDYGHWITVLGERIPNANPFQQGATAAANFLLAPNESQSRDVLQRMSTEGNQTRYVMVDWQMVTPSSKFGAPVVFYDDANVSRSDFLTPVYDSNGQFAMYQRNQRYYNSTMVRLYNNHGSRAEPTVSAGILGEYVVVFDYDVATTPSGQEFRTVPSGQNESALRTFQNMSAAREFVEEDGTATVGGVGAYPTEPVPALEHYRLVKASDTSGYASSSYQQIVYRQLRALGLQNPQLLQKTSADWVKTFERVPGATVEGSGAAPNETVTAAVQMEIPGGPETNASTFTYEQQATAGPDGNFQFTLPYASTGYDEFGPEEGYTNVSVRATGPYTVYGESRTNESSYLVRNEATLNVSNAAVVDAEDATVTLDERVLRSPEGAENNSTAGDDEGNASVSTGDESNATTNGSTTNESDATGTESAALAPRSPAAALRAADRRAVRP